MHNNFLKEILYETNTTNDTKITLRIGASWSTFSPNHHCTIYKKGSAETLILKKVLFEYHSHFIRKDHAD